MSKVELRRDTGWEIKTGVHWWRNPERQEKPPTETMFGRRAEGEGVTMWTTGVDENEEVLGKSGN